MAEKQLKMTASEKCSRLASPNERRNISRELHRFYNAVTVGAVYEVPSAFGATSPESFYAPLAECVRRNPYLSVVVRDQKTDKPSLERVAQLDLRKHIDIRDASVIKDADASSLETILPSVLDTPFDKDPDTPRWRIVVVPLSSNGKNTRFLVAFAFSHTLADGMSGLSFHRTFLTALSQPSPTTAPSPILTPNEPIPPPFDTPTNLPITWSYLLGPLMQTLLPSFIFRLLSLTPFSPANEHTWMGPPIFTPPLGEAPRTAVRVFEIPQATLDRALQVAKSHGAKFTALMHQLILQALAAHLPDDESKAAQARRNFVAITAMNMRGAVIAKVVPGVQADAPGNYVSGHSQRYDAPAPGSPIDWPAAAALTKSLAEKAGRLVDQSMGLMRYVSDINKWTTSKIGGKRDESYEVSNLGAFDGTPVEGGQGARITKALFAQPMYVPGAPLLFTTVAVKGKGMVVVVSWQPGALGVGDQSTEERVVDGVCADVREGFEKL